MPPKFGIKEFTMKTLDGKKLKMPTETINKIEINNEKIDCSVDTIYEPHKYCNTIGTDFSFDIDSDSIYKALSSMVGINTKPSIIYCKNCIHNSNKNHFSTSPIAHCDIYNCLKDNCGFCDEGIEMTD